MKRQAEQVLKEWSSQEDRSPLLLRGARQTGKSYLIENFGKQNFNNVITINFEKNPEYAQCFETFEPTEILQKISVIYGEPIEPGKTLLFLDEIQTCARAIQALRYFKEEKPSLHVIGAGSLLEFALNSADFKMPVGRVQYLYLKPFSFIEYLVATDKNVWVTALQEASLEKPLPDLLHQKLLQEVKIYSMLGGMPAVISQYIKQGPTDMFQRLQMSLLETYIDDFAKYASQAKQPHLRTVFDQIPRLIGQVTKYSKINPDVQSRFLKEAIHCLELAGVLYKIQTSTASGLPINALVNTNKYKMFFLDVGLISAKSGLSAEILMNKDLLAVDRGKIAEQFACQELLVQQSCFKKSELFYWENERKGAQAEVDFLIQHHAQIIPIEVKSGSTGRLKSLQVMMQEKKLPIGVRISQSPLTFDKNKSILSIPFYMVSEITRLVTVCA